MTKKAIVVIDFADFIVNSSFYLVVRGDRLSVCIYVHSEKKDTFPLFIYQICFAIDAARRSTTILYIEIDDGCKVVKLLKRLVKAKWIDV